MLFVVPLVAAAALLARQKQAEPAPVRVKNDEEKTEKRDK